VNDVPVWEDGDWSGLPALNGDITADVCVIGLGGSGLTAILELLRLGQRVVGIDAARVGAGAAGRNGGLLLAGLHGFHHEAVNRFGRERSAALYRRTLSELDRMCEETPVAIRRVGSLRVAGDAQETEDCITQYHAMRDDNLPVEEYDGPEGHGLLLPLDGAFDPLLRCRILAGIATDEGAQLFECTRATSVASGVVTTSTGTISCQQVIVAVDGQLSRILPELAGAVRDVRLQMLATEPATEIRLARPVYARYGYDYWHQLPDGRVAVGGWRDRTIATEWTDEVAVTEVVQRGLETILRDRIGVHAKVSHRWAGTVAYTATGLPIIRQVHPGVWAIGGYCGTGNIIGALCGRGVAQLAALGQTDLLSELDVTDA
jgi:glycine/D-amino acid oxidase-like deaminating enzyme